MKTKIGILVFSLFCQFSFCQILTRKPMEGQVVNDLVPVENVIVLNINSDEGFQKNQIQTILFFIL